MKKEIVDFVKNYRGMGLFLVLMIVFRSSFADWNTVPSGSMQPTIVEGDRILVNKLAYDLKIPLTHTSVYDFAEPQRGDIVIFDSHVLDMKLVKRLIGLPGDVVALRDNRLIVNGVEAQYSNVEHLADGIVAQETFGGVSHRIKLAPSGISRYSSYGPVTVPDGQYLMLGDNRDNSEDSRFIGFVPRAEIVGRTERVVLSFNYDNYYLPRKDRFFHTL
ncbi:signal peptidase I [Pseudolysobacter antarcticus]|nr:signal peptidase I [Pseudolysobacter antarcticus]